MTLSKNVRDRFDLSISLSQSPHSERADRPNAVLQPTYLCYYHRKYRENHEESENSTADIANKILLTLFTRNFMYFLVSLIQI